VSDCTFCSIGAGTIPASVVAETPNGMAFRDLNPAAPVHVLVIPKAHAADSAADPINADLWFELMGLVRQVVAKEHLEEGWRLVTNVGPDAGQSVHHLHLHLLGGRRMSWPPG